MQNHWPWTPPGTRQAWLGGTWVDPQSKGAPLLRRVVLLQIPLAAGPSLQSQQQMALALQVAWDSPALQALMPLAAALLEAPLLFALPCCVALLLDAWLPECKDLLPTACCQFEEDRLQGLLSWGRVASESSLPLGQLQTALHLQAGL